MNHEIAHEELEQTQLNALLENPTCSLILQPKPAIIAQVVNTMMKLEIFVGTEMDHAEKLEIIKNFVIFVVVERHLI